METFIEVLKCPSKKELAKLCKDHTILSGDFTDFIILCKSGICHLSHVMTFHDYVPEHLETTEEDFAILNAPKEVQQSPKGQSSFTRLFKAHSQRKYRVGHMFYEKSASDADAEWHFIFFELNELEHKNNHWVGGPHFHMVNYLWPNISPNDVWHNFAAKKEYPNTKLHIRYQENA